MKVESIPFDTAEQCIHHRFDDIANRFPERKAVSDEHLSYTYAQLQSEANKLADFIIRKLGPGSGNIVILIENNVHQLVAILGILKAGRSYVALDTSFPEDRNKLIIEDANGVMLLCTQDLKKEAARIGSDSVVEVVDEKRNIADDDLPEVSVLPTENAITLYTSGSTGEPKGVLQSHRNMVHFIKRMSEQHPIYPEDKVAYYLSVGFSAHALPMLGALLNGCELKIYAFTSGNFHGFSEWLKAEGITFIMTIPSFFRHFLAVQDKYDKYPQMRLIYFGGETLYRSDIEKARMVFEKHCLMINIYASTEAYIMRSFAIRQDTIIRSNIVPIGYAVDGMNLSLEDENGQIPAKGSLGEIILQSEYLTEGYQNKAEQEEKDFREDPENPSVRIFKTSDIGYMLDDDCMVHAGRKDSMIKLRGFRIDFGEIINILLSADNIKEADCALKTNPQGVAHIIAYVVAVDHSKADFEYLNALLVRMLPGYMIPTHIIELPALPKNAIGKTDSSDLPEPDWFIEDDNEASSPENETEAELIEIFKKTLKLEVLGTKDNLMKTGADSLGLFVAFSEIEKRFNIKLDIQKIIESPDVKSIAAYVLKNKEG